jgi:hypothetical protein
MKKRLAAALVLASSAAVAQEVDLEAAREALDKAATALSDPRVVSALDRARAEARRVHGFDEPALQRSLEAAANLAAVRMPAFSKDSLLILDMAAQAQNRADRPSRDEHDYQAGTRALDANRFDEAISRFDGVIDRKGSRADAALYWKAYAQNRLGRRADAQQTVAQLRRDYPQSRWLNDAQALEVEIRNQQGNPVNPDSESNEELKLIALTGLMQSDPQKAMPILEKLLASNQSPKVKDKALFVLTQSGSPEAQQILLNIARGKSNPDVLTASRRRFWSFSVRMTSFRRSEPPHSSMMGSKEGKAELGNIYASSSDINLKREIIRSYLLSGSKDKLLQAAKSEKTPELRREAIRTLAQTGGKDELWELYKVEPSGEVKAEIIRSMLLCGGSDRLKDVIRTEKDQNLRREAVKTLGLTGADGATFTELYRNESDEGMKREIVRALFISGNSKALVDLARLEKNPELKEDIVKQLSLMHSKEATDYMLEILK